MELHFYYCEICGKLIAVFSDSKIPTICCGKPMKELIPNGTDGAAEKHVPVYDTLGTTVRVCVGTEPHPMTEVHSITWIGLRSAQGFQFKDLYPEDKPEAEFAITPGDTVEAVYAFCNIHGLWFADKEEKI